MNVISKKLAEFFHMTMIKGDHVVNSSILTHQVLHKFLYLYVWFLFKSVDTCFWFHHRGFF